MTITSDGNVVELEERTCACGCGKAFKALKTGDSRYWSVRHNPMTKNVTDWLFTMENGKESREIYGFKHDEVTPQ